MPPSTAFRIEPLTPARADDYLRFFNHETGPAFADNPEWATCYCHYYEVPVTEAWSSFDGPANQAAMGARITAGEMEGFLAYHGDDLVGWINAQPYSKLQHACARLRIAAPPLAVPPNEAAAIVCFVTAPEWRRHGVARALLAGALESFTERRLALVDAFPWNVGPEDTSPTDHYHGSPSMFSAAGFVPIATHDKVTVVRRMLR